MAESPTLTFYVASVLVHWDSLAAETPMGRLPLTGPSPGSLGFLPVFESAEAAETAYPGAAVLTIRGVPRV